MTRPYPCPILGKRATSCGGDQICRNACKHESLEELLACYQQCEYQAYAAELAYYRELSSLPAAVVRSVASVNSSGVMCLHQRRLGRELLGVACKHLTTQRALCRIGDAREKDFETLHSVIAQLCRESGLPRLGPLFVYDVALRLADPVLSPVDNVYLHAGTAKGFRFLCRLFPGISFFPTVPPKRRLTAASFNPFADWSCEHIESFLCVYANELETLVFNVKDTHLSMLKP